MLEITPNNVFSNNNTKTRKDQMNVKKRRTGDRFLHASVQSRQSKTCGEPLKYTKTHQCGRKDKQTDAQTDRQTDRQTGKQIPHL